MSTETPEQRLRRLERNRINAKRYYWEHRDRILQENKTPEKRAYKARWATAWNRAHPDLARAKHAKYEQRRRGKRVYKKRPYKPRIRTEEQKQRYNAAARKKRAENRDAYNERARLRRLENLEARRETARAYRAANREKLTAQKKRYIKRYPDQYKAIQDNRRARKIGAKGSHTAAEIADLYLRQGKKCATCKTVISDKKGPTKFHLDHVVALAVGGTNDISNLALLCASCNKRKHIKSPEVWAAMNGLLFI